MKFIAAALSLFPFMANAADGYDDLAKKSIELVKVNNESLTAKYKMGTWKRWNLDQVTGLLKFSSDDKEVLVFKSCVIGSISTKSGTWLWSWANKSILESMSSPSLPVKEYGLKMGYEMLSNSKCDADETLGWEISSIACNLIKGLGVYRGPTSNGFIFIVPMELVKYDP